MENTVEKRMIGNCAVYIGDDILHCITPYLRTAFEEGALLCLYDSHLSSLAEDVMRHLKKDGYRVFAKSVKSARSRGDEKRSFEEEYGDVPEFTRYILAIGAGSVADEAKSVGRMLNIGWSLVLSAPSTDTIMCGYCPNQVFIDKNVLIKCKVECIASGYGILMSSGLSAFENFFNRKVLAMESKDIDVVDFKNIDVVQLAFALLESSYQKKENSADIMARILYFNAKKNGKTPRLIGEYKFLASALLMAFYRAFLGAPSIDIMPPANMYLERDKLSSLSGKLDAGEKSVDFFDYNSYFRISYILGEYRMDLLDKLSSVDVHSMQRFWRRLYPDAGYWLKGEISAEAMLKCLNMTGERSDSLLGYAYASGVMAKF